MKTGHMAVRIGASLLIVAYLVFMPRVLKAELTGSDYSRRKHVKGADYSAVISLWHVVSFRPYKGALSTWLNERAGEFEDANKGIFIEVTAMDMAEYAERTARGEKPDMYSFPLGLCYQEQLSRLDIELPDGMSDSLYYCGAADGKFFAAPYAMSAYFLMVNRDIALSKSVSIPSEAPDSRWIDAAADSLTYDYGKSKHMCGISGSAIMGAVLGLEHEFADYELFKSGVAAMAIADARAVADIRRAYQAGKGFPVESWPITGFTDQVQLIAVSASCDERKAEYAAAVAEHLLSAQAQEKLFDVGMKPIYPVDADKDETPSDDTAAQICSALDGAFIPNSFLYQRYHDMLEDTALRALSGDTHAQNDFDTRVKELVYSHEIK